MYGTPPQVTNKVVAAYRKYNGAEEGTDIHGHDDFHQFGKKVGREPVHGKEFDDKVKVLCDRTESNQVANDKLSVKDKWHGYRVGDPNEADTDRNVELYKRYH